MPAWPAEDEAALRDAAAILSPQADDMVSFYRARLGEQPWLAPYSQHPDGTPPLRYVLAFTAVVVSTARRFLAAEGASGEELDRLDAAFTKSVILHVTVWSRAYGDAGGLW